jgi:hypothetical protein
MKRVKIALWQWRCAKVVATGKPCPSMFSAKDLPPKFRLLSVAIGPFWLNSAQKFRMRRRWTDVAAPSSRETRLLLPLPRASSQGANEGAPLYFKDDER